MMDLNGDWKTVYEGDVLAGDLKIVVEKKVRNVAPNGPSIRVFLVAGKPVVRDGNDIFVAGPPDEYEASSLDEMVEKLKPTGVPEKEVRDAVRHALDP